MSPSAPAEKVWTNFMLFPLMSVDFWRRDGEGKYFGTLSGKGRWRWVVRAITVALLRRSIYN